MKEPKTGYHVTYKEPKKPIKPIFEKDRIIPRIEKAKQDDELILDNGGNGWK